MTVRLFVVADGNLQRPQHLREQLLLAINEKHIVENDRSRFVAGVKDQSPGTEQHVFKDVVNLFVDPQVWSWVSFQIGKEAVMMQQFVWSDFPVVVPNSHQHSQVEAE